MRFPVDVKQTTRNLALGALAGAAGTVAMDLVLYGRYRRGGGTDSLWRWEFAGGVTNWGQASAPGQVGEKLEQLATGEQPPDSWARPTTNLVHWATGIGWGVQYGVLASITARLPGSVRSHSVPRPGSPAT